MFLTIRFKIVAIIFSVLLFFIVFLFAVNSAKTTSTPKQVYSIVIDAGHGGIDGGCEGVSTGVKESDLNLKYSLKLAQFCQNLGFKVILTRKDENGLYAPFSTNKKRSEMEKRESIIKKSNADLFVSVHMNSFPNKSLSGAQVFYKIENEKGKELADSITNALKGDIELRGNSKEGDYYVLNCHDKAGVLIECGFLSNPEEERLLQTEEYVDKFCQKVFQGILSFLKM